MCSTHRSQQGAAWCSWALSPVTPKSCQQGVPSTRPQRVGTDECCELVCEVLVLCKDPWSPAFLLTPAAASGPPFPLITCTPSSHWPTSYSPPHRQVLWACLWGSGSVQRPLKPCIPVDASCSLRSPLPAHHLHPKLPLLPATLLPTLKAPTEPRIPSLLNFSLPITPCS